MRSFNEIEKKLTPKEIAEALVFPMSTDSNEREKMISAFKGIRKRYLENQSEESKMIVKLLQLKFLIED